MTGTLSFYECRLNGVTLKPYLLQSNLFERFALRGGGDTIKSSLCPSRLLDACAPTSHPVKLSLPNIFNIINFQTKF